jgi:hypothetical protein
MRPGAVLLFSGNSDYNHSRRAAEPKLEEVRMKKLIFFLAVLSLSFILSSPAFASSELDSFIKSVNVQAQADLGAFKLRLSTQFGIPVPKVEALMVKVATPGDAYMCLRVGQVASKPIDAVMNEYQANKGKGWGAIAKNLGIKPGSKEFHALKKGDFNGEDSDSGKGKGKGKTKGKGH